ncbi:MAG: GvpL/GvpF family gas vesicle protein [Methanoregula sp.]|nr:GvpL/GvpF family gas vesicle protein [Methanoregula sp.]
MNKKQREKLTRVLQEILDEEIESITNETRAIMSDLVKKEGIPALRTAVSTTVADATAGIPDPALKSSFRPGPLTPGRTENIPLRDTIPSAGQSVSPESPLSEDPGAPGLYLYGIAAGATPVHYESSGIDGQDVYSIHYRELMAIVHDCPARPYESTDKEVVKDWVLAHEKIIEHISGDCGTVMPFSFDTIIKPDGNKTAQEMLLHWMSEEYERLENTIKKISGKKEYGVQIFYSPSLMGERVASMNPAIKNLQEEMKHRGPGMEYMVRQKIEQELKAGMESEAATLVHDCYKKIKDACDDVKIEKIKKSAEKEKKMLMNCSCLVSDENYSTLGDVLETIEKEYGLSVRFTGPWPVYSFV